MKSTIAAKWAVKKKKGKFRQRPSYITIHDSQEGGRKTIFSSAQASVDAKLRVSEKEIQILN